MKKYLLIALLFYYYGLSAEAQEEKTYYRIMSAKPSFAGKCIQDHSNTNGADDYLIEDWNANNKRQEWDLIPADDNDNTLYYIRNRNSRRYIGQATTLVDNKYYYTASTPALSSSPKWTVTDIGDGMVTFSTTDEYGVIRFLNAADIKKSPERIYSTKAAKKTGFAWRIINAKADPTAIKSQTDKSIKVSALNGHIIVAGTDDYTISDLQGRSISPDSRLQKGVYIVTTKEESFKVLIK